MDDQRVECSWATGPRPERLYKYKSLRGEGIHHVEQVLVHRSMWLSAPSQFNDPWEGRFSLDFAGSESDKLATYRQMIAWEFGENVPEQVVDEQAKQWLNDQPDEATVRQAAKHAIENSRACLRILSLTEKPDDLLMWAYYADAHAGICFEFDTTAGDDSIFANALPVDYRDDFPVVEFYKQEAVIDKVRYVAFMKSTSWSHEKEWRVVKPSDDPTPSGLIVSYPEGALRSVILGSDVPKDQEKTIAGWAVPSGVDLRRARRKVGQYGLEIVAQ